MPLLDRYDMKSAFLFGSYARGDADEDSDIDVLVVGNEGFLPLDILVWPRNSIGSREKRLTYTSSRSFSGPLQRCGI
ncbi:nucleotidyltransferase family protein [Parvibacter caecicola]|uniref:nucleotidyltransferase family protein n=1 Tax=Parvibacter caecicola TaxID=747645 RepID=UPI003F73E27E